MGQLQAKISFALIFLFVLGVFFLFFSYLPTFLPKDLFPSEYVQYLPVAIIITIFVVGGAIYFNGQTKRTSGEL